MFGINDFYPLLVDWRTFNSGDTLESGISVYALCENC